MQELSEAIQELPLESWIPIVGIIVLGVAMWAAGQRLLRPAFASLGLLVGAGGGWLLAGSIDFGVPTWVIAVAGGLLVAALAVLAYKATIAGGLALVLALAASLGTWSLNPSPSAESDPAPEAAGDPEPGPADRAAAAIDEIDQWLRGLQDGEILPTSPAAPPAPTPDPPGVIEDGIERARTLANAVIDQITAQWHATEPVVRNRVLGAAVLGGLIGFIMGTLASGFSASLVTAFGGSMACMIGGWSAASRFDLPAAGWLPSSPNAWLSWWVILSVIGLLIQWTARPKRADNPG